MTLPPDYAALAEVVEWRRNAWLGNWITFAVGEPLDSKHPTVALVKGWERLGRVEVKAGRGVGGRRTFHQFSRTKSDFPAGWFDPPKPLPEPPAIRDAEAVGTASMAHWAIEGGEDEGWIRRAVLEYSRRLAVSPDSATIAEAGILLHELARLMDVDGDTARLARIGWRKPGGGQATGRRWGQVLKEWGAANAVLKAESDGDKRYIAIPNVAKETGLSEGTVKARLAQRRKIKTWPERKHAAEAADTARAMTRGGLLLDSALALAADLHGLSVDAVQKALKKL